jgi:DNA-binding NarL/FixJ family response regulator
VTPKTVEHHVTNILGRLSLRTRTEVAAWVHRTAGES